MSPRSISRREMLARCSSGFGLLALSDLLARGSALAPVPQFRPRARSVILCYMSGGTSHVDSFDPKPTLAIRAGQPMPMEVERTQFNNNGTIFPSPFRFDRYGRSGLEVSEIFREIGSCADDLAVVRSMTSKVSEHAQGNYFMHTCMPFMGYPSAGAWVSYGLGSANDNLPSFVVLQSGGAVPPHGGVGLFSCGFLPAQHQASIIMADGDEALRNIRPGAPKRAQRRMLDFVAALDAPMAAENPDVEAAVRNYETAFRMQAAVPDVTDLRGESELTRRMYGLDDADVTTAAYGRQCLIARRLVERGVRFIELSCINRGIGAGNAPNPWDQHSDLEKGHRAMAHQVDQPIAGLLRDLKGRGLLDETLVIWTGEFGRTPFSQGSNGRDHNPLGFSVWMAGGGTVGGTVYGATDAFGYHAVENPCTTYDLWATVLRLMGIDHEQLTHRYAGRDVRLTDVHGKVLDPLLA